ncbi:MAG TPA: hypothetical protein VER36_07600 [Flavisolibacter sp.]|nr:hypothetical protein [Flavisolibacter sp.]
MIRNLQIEWMKIKNYRVFQVFSVLYMLGIVVIIYIFYQIYTQLTGRLTGQDGNDLFRLFSPDTIWKTVCFATSFLLYLPGMILINLFINEVNFKTHRQNIIDGWKRETFIFTKIGLIICISLAVLVMNIVATAIMCNVTNTEFSLTSGLPVLGVSFIQSFIYMMFALLLATVFRRSGIAIIVFFIYGLLLENLFAWALWKILPAGSQHFLPLQVADSLIPFINEGIYASNPGLSVMVPAALAFAGLYIFLAVRKYKFDDL